MPIGARTLGDVVAGSDRESKKFKFIVNMMAHAAPIIEDSLWVPSNNKLSHRVKLRVGLPTAAWRRLYKGVQPSKSTFAVVEETCGLLYSRSTVDVDAYDGSGDKAEQRLQEAIGHMMAMGQELESHFFYGSESSDPESFTGLSPRYGSLSADVSENIIDGGGTGATNTSIWLITWGLRTCHLFYPAGTKAGIEHIAKDNATVADADGNNYEADLDIFKMRPGLALPDWRYNVRICNLDTSTFGGSSAPDLITLMNKALWKLPTTTLRQTAVEGLDDEETRGFVGGKPIFYMNKATAEELERQVDAKTNVRITRDEAANSAPVVTFKGVPVHVTDSLLSTETALT